MSRVSWGKCRGVEGAGVGEGSTSLAHRFWAHGAAGRVTGEALQIPKRACRRQSICFPPSASVFEFSRLKGAGRVGMGHGRPWLCHCLMTGPCCLVQVSLCRGSTAASCGQEELVPERKGRGAPADRAPEDGCNTPNLNLSQEALWQPQEKAWSVSLAPRPARVSSLHSPPSTGSSSGSGLRRATFPGPVPRSPCGLCSLRRVAGSGRPPWERLPPAWPAPSPLCCPSLADN